MISLICKDEINLRDFNVVSLILQIKRDQLNIFPYLFNNNKLYGPLGKY